MSNFGVNKKMTVSHSITEPTKQILFNLKYLYQIKRDDWLDKLFPGHPLAEI